LEIPFDNNQEVEEAVQRFLNWMFDKSNEHNFRVKEQDGRSYCCYRGEALVLWLNLYYFGLTEKKAMLITQSAKTIDQSKMSIDL